MELMKSKRGDTNIRLMAMCQNVIDTYPLHIDDSTYVQLVKAYRVFLSSGIEPSEEKLKSNDVFNVIFSYIKLQVGAEVARKIRAYENGMKGKDYGALGGRPRKGTEKKNKANNPPRITDELPPVAAQGLKSIEKNRAMTEETRKMIEGFYKKQSSAHTHQEKVVTANEDTDSLPQADLGDNEGLFRGFSGVSGNDTNSASGNGDNGEKPLATNGRGTVATNGKNTGRNPQMASKAKRAKKSASTVKTTKTAANKMADASKVSASKATGAVASNAVNADTANVISAANVAASKAGKVAQDKAGKVATKNSDKSGEKGEFDLCFFGAGDMDPLASRCDGKAAYLHEDYFCNLEGDATEALVKIIRYQDARIQALETNFAAVSAKLLSQDKQQDEQVNKELAYNNKPCACDTTYNSKTQVASVLDTSVLDTKSYEHDTTNHVLEIKSMILDTKNMMLENKSMVLDTKNMLLDTKNMIADTKNSIQELKMQQQENVLSIDSLTKNVHNVLGDVERLRKLIDSHGVLETHEHDTNTQERDDSKSFISCQNVSSVTKTFYDKENVLSNNKELLEKNKKENVHSHANVPGKLEDNVHEHANVTEHNNIHEQDDVPGHANVPEELVNDPLEYHAPKRLTDEDMNKKVLKLLELCTSQDKSSSQDNASKTKSSTDDLSKEQDLEVPKTNTSQELPEAKTSENQETQVTKGSQEAQDNKTSQETQETKDSQKAQETKDNQEAPSFFEDPLTGIKYTAKEIDAPDKLMQLMDAGPVDLPDAELNKLKDEMLSKNRARNERKRLEREKRRNSLESQESTDTSLVKDTSQDTSLKASSETNPETSNLEADVQSSSQEIASETTSNKTSGEPIGYGYDYEDDDDQDCDNESDESDGQDEVPADESDLASKDMDDEWARLDDAIRARAMKAKAMANSVSPSSLSSSNTGAVNPTGSSTSYDSSELAKKKELNDLLGNMMDSIKKDEEAAKKAKDQQEPNGTSQEPKEPSQGSSQVPENKPAHNRALDEFFANMRENDKKEFEEQKTSAFKAMAETVGTIVDNCRAYGSISLAIAQKMHSIANGVPAKNAERVLDACSEHYTQELTSYNQIECKNNYEIIDKRQESALSFLLATGDGLWSEDKDIDIEPSVKAQLQDEIALMTKDSQDRLMAAGSNNLLTSQEDIARYKVLHTIRCAPLKAQFQANHPKPQNSLFPGMDYDGQITLSDQTRHLYKIAKIHTLGDDEVHSGIILLDSKYNRLLDSDGVIEIGKRRRNQAVVDELGILLNAGPGEFLDKASCTRQFESTALRYCFPENWYQENKDGEKGLPWYCVRFVDFTKDEAIYAKSEIGNIFANQKDIGNIDEMERFEVNEDTHFAVHSYRYLQYLFGNKMPKDRAGQLAALRDCYKYNVACLVQAGFLKSDEIRYLDDSTLDSLFAPQLKSHTFKQVMIALERSVEYDWLVKATKYSAKAMVSANCFDSLLNDYFAKISEDDWVDTGNRYAQETSVLDKNATLNACFNGEEPPSGFSDKTAHFRKMCLEFVRMSTQLDKLTIAEFYAKRQEISDIFGTSWKDIGREDDNKRYKAFVYKA